MSVQYRGPRALRWSAALTPLGRFRTPNGPDRYGACQAAGPCAGRPSPTAAWTSVAGWDPRGSPREQYKRSPARPNAEAHPAPPTHGPRTGHPATGRERQPRGRE